ncbi:hypothetical protein [Magnetospirillum molischianum]|uniref:Uncharacterized protein n=1 Tax=Magnetospirillum molischianum DSM 120 TaxID=1150626 RepID=H8FR93_MAGML|nr:hypothetical protein [Magnetospirillum molischianum]CCG40881.1 hypothetical protein PHAMO_210393 [Magnetospirillum molischianum DSM 120]
MDMNSQRQHEGTNGPDNPVRRAAYEDALSRVQHLRSFSESLNDEQRASLISDGPITIGCYTAPSRSR